MNATTIGRYYFAERTGLLTDVERVIGDDYEGDAVVRVRMSDYRAEGGTMVPGMIEQFTGTSATMRVKPVVVLLGQAPAESLFTLPAGLTDVPRQPPAEPAFDQVGPGVYLASGMAGGYRMLVADFGDHLAVMESPNGSEQSGRAIAKINAQFPGKPIKYVIPTHHHDDHAGGLRAFVAAGAVVVTTRGNAKVFRRMAAAPYTIEPDEQAAQQKPVQFLFVEGKLVLEGGGTRLEIIDVGPEPARERDADRLRAGEQVRVPGGPVQHRGGRPVDVGQPDDGALLGVALEERAGGGQRGRDAQRGADAGRTGCVSEPGKGDGGAGLTPAVSLREGSGHRDRRHHAAAVTRRCARSTQLTTTIHTHPTAGETNRV